MTLTEPPDKSRVGALLDRLVRYYTLNKREASQKWVRYVVEATLRPAFGKLKSGRLKRSDLEEFIRRRSSDGRSNSTIRKELSLLQRAFKLADIAFPRIIKPQENNVRTGMLSDDDFEAIYRQLPEHAKVPVLFAFFTWCRRGEIMNLKWSEVHLDRRIVRLLTGETKSGQGRLIPLKQRLAIALGNLPKVDGCDYIFTRAGRRVKDIRGAWESACVRAGLADAQGKLTCLDCFNQS